MTFAFNSNVRRQFVILEDERLTDAVRRIVQKLVSVSPQPNLSSEITLLNDPLPVISSSPGGVFISTGLLELCQNPDELAAAIGHGLAHRNLGHQISSYLADTKTYEGKRNAALKTQKILSLLALAGAVGGGVLAGVIAPPALIVAIANAGPRRINIDELPNRRALVSRFGSLRDDASDPRFYVAPTLFTFLREFYEGYSVGEEQAADNLAVQYMIAAGYEPGGLLTLLRAFAALRNDYLNKGYFSHFINAEPGLEGRLGNVQAELDKPK